MGLSYAAHTQVALACLNPPGLRAMYIDCGGFSNAYQDGIRQGGAFELKQVTWAYHEELESPQAKKDPRLLAALKAVDLKAWFSKMPWKRRHTPISLIPEYESYVYEQWEHGKFDGFWKQLSLPTAGAGSLTFDFNPDHPVPSMGGTITSGEPLMHGGGFDQGVERRPDVLVFQTEPLTGDVEVTGAIEANLWISSDAVDTDFTFKLIDLYPPSEDYPEGYALNLTDGILRCRYRRSWSDPSLMTPGEIYAIRVAAFPTSNLFKRGHRVRLDISSSNFPHFDVNPNTGAPEGTGMQRRVARNTVHMDARHPSHVILPLMVGRPS